MKITLVLIFNALFFHLLWGLDFRVSNNADSGPNSLRQAIDDLNASLAESNTITFDAGLGTITLLSDLPLIAIQGTFITAANDALVIDGNAGPYRVFGSQDVNITINASNASILTVSGLIDQGSLICSGAGGTIGLNGINTYTGGTVISSNMILTLSGTGVLDPNGSVVINSSTLDISAITPPSQTITTLSGNGTGEIILGTKALIVNTPITTTYPGIISGTGSFTKQGLGTLVLTGANVYSGGTTVSAGVLQGNTTSLQGNILDNARVVFDQTGVGTYAGIISGSGSITKQNGGTLVLTGANVYSGGTTVSAGVLQGNTISLQGNILDNASVVFDQTGTRSMRESFRDQET